MPIEIEAKLKVEELDSIRQRLEQCAASFVGIYLETNVFFDREDRTLLAADKGLRLRKTRDRDGSGKRIVLTFKGPRQRGTLKSREEIEVGVDDFDSAASLLQRLGLVSILSFEKKRESWELGGCKVELDELPHLGHFVEIEGPDEHTVMKVREKLQLGGQPLIRAPYVALLMTYLQEHDQSRRVVTFG